MFRYILAAALLCGSLLVGHAQADNAWFSLNLEFNDPTDAGSGGTWTVVTKADRRGLSAVVLSFDATSLNFNAATGFLTPAVWTVEESGVFGMRLETVQGDDLASPVYDVGVIGGTFPSTYVDDPSLVVFGANPDLGSFTGGVELVTGSFNAGDIPAWWTGADPTAALLFTGSGSQVVDAAIHLTVRSNLIPEPTSLLLACGSIMGLAAMRRR
jgi:hypothetical protein